MNDRIRVGVVGGGMGSCFQFHEHPHSVVEAICDLDPSRRQRLKDTYRCDKEYTTLDEMLADPNVDAVAVFSGAPDHVPHAVAAMSVGKHVFSAVPAAVSLEQSQELLDSVKSTGMTYMMAETSYYYQLVISARKFFQEGRFGDIFYSESEYQHGGMEYSLWHDKDGKPTWRHGFPPMLYPTHCTSFLIGVTGERLTEVMCTGWGDGDPVNFPNAYENPFWSQNAFFRTNRGNSHRASIYWRGAFGPTVGGRWYGEKMSLFADNPLGLGPMIVEKSEKMGADDIGYAQAECNIRPYEGPEWWLTDMLPEELRHVVPDDSSHNWLSFLTHEFIDALVSERTPAIDIYEALAYTVPGIIAHQSALRGGEPMKIPSFDPIQ